MSNATKPQLPPMLNVTENMVPFRVSYIPGG
jgi:hypothetical protein